MNNKNNQKKKVFKIFIFYNIVIIINLNQKIIFINNLKVDNEE